MSQIIQEYSATSANARPCYSNLYNYGTNGKWRPIIPPTPVTLEPSIFNHNKPHNIHSNDVPVHKKETNCIPYRHLGNTCPN